MKTLLLYAALIGAPDLTVDQFFDLGADYAASVEFAAGPPPAWKHACEALADDGRADIAACDW